MAGGGEEEAARLMVGSGEELQRSHTPAVVGWAAAGWAVLLLSVGP